MATIGLNALARATGRAKSGLHKLAKRGVIPRNSDGSFDLAAVQHALVTNLDPAQQRPVTRSPGDRSRRTGDQPSRDAAPPPVKTEAEALDAVSLVRRVLEQRGQSAQGAVDFQMARTAESILKSRERELKMAERRKELVPIAAVRSHITKAFIGYRQAVQRIPARHAAAMAAELGVDAGKLEKMLTRAIQQELDALSAPLVRAP